MGSLPFFLAACAVRQPFVSPPETAFRTAFAPYSDTATVLQGFDVVWQRLPHRISHMSIQTGATTTTEMRGGSWTSGRRGTDTPNVEVRYGTVTGENLLIARGSAAFDLRGAVSQKQRPNEPAEASAVIRMPMPARRGGDDVAVWLSGFELSTAASHPEGFTPHRVSVRLDEPTVADGELYFRVYTSFEAGPTWDRRQWLGAYGCTVQISWVVATAPGGHAQRFDATSMINRGLGPFAQARKTTPARVLVGVTGVPGLDGAIAGLSAFDLEVTSEGPTAGRYLRALTVDLEGDAYDPDSGRYQGVSVLRFANAGPLPRSMRVDARAVYTLFQLPEAQPEGRRVVAHAQKHTFIDGGR